MWNAELDESQAGIKTAGRNIKKPQICRWYHPNYTWGTLRINNCGGEEQSANFLLDTGTTFSVHSEAPGSFSPDPLP